MTGFIEFVRKQGVVGLAIGFVLGGAVQKLVSALVEDIVNPLVGLALGKAGDLSLAVWTVGTATIKWGDFVSRMIDFFIIALVVYLGFRLLRLDRLDLPK
ncbi:MAG: MscL family protein [Patescibacteria group bacterium]